MAMRKYTDVEREEAADACAMMASSDDFYLPGAPALDLSDAVDHARVQELAAAAFAFAANHVSAWWRSRERWAEAEARLRCGWTPGDDEVTR